MIKESFGLGDSIEEAKENALADLGADETADIQIEVIEIACDECPVGGYEVTNACRGCLAHRCEDACKFGAITFDNNHVAHIDKNKCKECGKRTFIQRILSFSYIF